jgi:hypothetical protein
MGKVWAIAVNTFREAVRNRILYILLIFAIVLLLFSGMVRELTISSQDYVIKSLGLGAINIFGLLIAIFVGIGLVYNELDKKTIYTIVSKPIDRWHFIVGKYFGLLLTIYVNILIMTVFFYGALYWQDLTSDAAMARLEQAGPLTTSGLVAYYAKAAGLSVAGAFKSLFFFPDPITEGLQPVILMTCLELAIITAFAVLYSSFSTPTLSAMLTVFTFVIGRANDDITRYTMYLARNGIERSEAVKYYGAKFASYVAPNLKWFYSNTAYKALSYHETGYNPRVILYGVAYSAIIMTLAVLVFRRRNFK